MNIDAAAILRSLKEQWGNTPSSWDKSDDPPYGSLQCEYLTGILLFFVNSIKSMPKIYLGGGRGFMDVSCFAIQLMLMNLYCL